MGVHGNAHGRRYQRPARPAQVPWRVPVPNPVAFRSVVPEPAVAHGAGDGGGADVSRGVDGEHHCSAHQGANPEREENSRASQENGILRGSHPGQGGAQEVLGGTRGGEGAVRRHLRRERRRVHLVENPLRHVPTHPVTKAVQRRETHRGGPRHGESACAGGATREGSARTRRTSNRGGGRGRETQRQQQRQRRRQG